MRIVTNIAVGVILAGGVYGFYLYSPEFRFVLQKLVVFLT
jgi:hypothetical protein